MTPFGSNGDGSPLRGHTALVTGSSRGLGLLVARELADRGCRVMLCARGERQLAAAEAALRARGSDVASLACDVTAPETPRRLLDAVAERFGDLDVLVNNAGVIQVGAMEAMGERQYREAMETMFFAPLRLTLAALPGLRTRPGARVVNIGSIGGRIAPPHLLPYAAAKFAVTGWSEGLRAELAAQGISVTTVLPGLMRTGSHTAALFHGDAAHEYAWFAPGASLPLVSMNAERAARAIVRAAERRRTELVLTPLAKTAVRAHGIAPATTTRLMSVAARMLPGAGTDAEREGVTGAGARQRLGSRVVDRLTTLGDRAADHFNQRSHPG
ncbi:SDR family NAD(P)-dependent oxidoreductase [Streptomyces sp. ICBB 8177]|uniref:SDR family NAD(P)-dependent oxidoreductase n=1 Tax=Streptomyces sp. ICBB 8177 TaxID=563922 RepID=UPI000D684C69|nr:SDR family NAD(P)-dependent oxidoreductase [Streptomyces sp. ICBB 8177]PWI42821.1 short-chain dehydrogenase [Streptomyces sp. ICBB 8177]